MTLVQDLRFAIRMILKERWFTAVAVLALSLGIGLNATVFTLVNAVLIRGLPFKDSDRLYMLGSERASTKEGGGVSYADLQDWRAQSRTFSAFGSFAQEGGMNVSDDTNAPEQFNGVWLSADAFRGLGQ